MMAMFGNTVRSERGVGPGLSSVSHPHGAAAKRGMFSIIGPDVVITGNIVATADLHIDGRVDGDVQCGALVQGNDGRINGAVKAESARLGGTIEGSVAVRQLTIERAARITGDVEYETITIETGASIDGRLKHLAADAAAFAPTPLHIATPLEDVVHFTATGHAA
jgi:cytoskeletal protein CcmA (bactofilin family)